MEHRWGKRVATNIAVRLIAPGGRIGAGCVRDVSSSGAFIETTLQLRPLTWVQIEPQRGPGRRDTRARIAGCVIRTAHTGIGIEWCDDPDEAIEGLLPAMGGMPARDAASGPELPRAREARL